MDGIWCAFFASSFFFFCDYYTFHGNDLRKLSRIRHKAMALNGIFFFVLSSSAFDLEVRFLCQVQIIRDLEVNGQSILSKLRSLVRIYEAMMTAAVASL
jgi:hypothetical protein